jgi:hypothetical protein
MYLRKRIETLEASLAPRGRRVCIWGMTSGNDVGFRLKTNREIEAEISAGQRLGSIGPNDQVDVVSWQMSKEASYGEPFQAAYRSDRGKTWRRW